MLGAEAVIAKSFERIHRSNLIGMGVLPLQFEEGEDAASLGLTGEERFTIHISDDVKPQETLTVDFERENGMKGQFEVVCRLDTRVEIDYYRNGGILHTVLRAMHESEAQAKA